jgi:hypothetical protein
MSATWRVKRAARAAGAEPAQHAWQLPKAVMAPAGPFKVVRARLPDNQCGYCDYMTRTIRIDESEMADVTVQAILWHEWMHAVLWDVGVKLDEADAERVCNAVGLAMTVLSREG